MVASFKARVNNPITKLILIKLSDNANDEGYCFPSYQHIANQCEVSRSTAIAHVKILKNIGVLTSNHRMKNGENTSNEFRISLEKLIELGSPADAPPSAGDGLGSPADGLGVVRQMDPESSSLTINKPLFNLNTQKTKNTENKKQDILKDWTPNKQTLEAFFQRAGVKLPEEKELQEIIFQFNLHNSHLVIPENQKYSKLLTWIKRGSTVFNNSIKQPSSNHQVNQKTEGNWRYPFSYEIEEGKYQAGDHVPC